MLPTLLAISAVFVHELDEIVPGFGSVEPVSLTLDEGDPPVLGRGPTERFSCIVERSGWVTAWVEDAEFSPYLRLDVEGRERREWTGPSEGQPIPLVSAFVPKGTPARLIVGSREPGELGSAKLHVRGTWDDEAEVRLFNEVVTELQSAFDEAQTEEWTQAWGRIDTLAEELLRVGEGTRSFRVAKALQELADFSMAYVDVWTSARARELALEFFESSLPARHPEVRKAQVQLAESLAELGDYARAHALFNLAYDAALETDPADSLAVVDLGVNLGMILSSQGGVEELEQAKVLMEAAVEKLRELHPPGTADSPTSHASLDGALTNLGRVERMLGDPERALELLVPVGEKWDRERGELDLGRIWLQQEIALTHAAAGDTDRAFEVFEPVLELRSRMLRGGSRILIKTQRNGIVMLRELADRGSEEALEKFSVLLDTYLREIVVRLDLASAELGPREASITAADMHTDVNLLLTFLLDPGPFEPVLAERAETFPHRVFEIVEGVRALETRAASLMARPADPGRAERARAHGESASQLLERMRTAMQDSGSAEELAGLVGARDRALRSLLEDVRREGRSSILESGEIAAGLGPKEILLSYWFCDPYFAIGDPSILPDSGGTRGEDRCLAFVLDHRGRLAVVPLGLAEEIVEASFDWQLWLGLREPLESWTDEEREEKERLTHKKVSKRVREAAIEVGELERLHGRAKRVYVCAPDPLYYVPFDGLLVRRGKCLGDEREYVTTRSAAGLVELRRGEAPAGGGRLVAFGPVEFEPDSGGSGRPLGRLRESGAELGATARAFEASFGSSARSELFEGSRATVHAFRTAVAGATYLHVSTHGMYDPDPDRISARTRSFLDQTAAAMREPVSALVPKLLCSLAFAPGESGEGGGPSGSDRLLAEEIAFMDLEGCELVVLSNCDGAAGVARSYQGAHTLLDAFLTAGARSAIAALWEVEDPATRRLMEELYRNLWVEGQSKPQALWNAKRALWLEGFPVSDGWPGSSSGTPTEAPCAAGGQPLARTDRRARRAGGTGPAGAAPPRLGRRRLRRGDAGRRPRVRVPGAGARVRPAPGIPPVADGVEPRGRIGRRGRGLRLHLQGARGVAVLRSQPGEHRVLAVDDRQERRLRRGASRARAKSIRGGERGRWRPGVGPPKGGAGLGDPRVHRARAEPEAPGVAADRPRPRRPGAVPRPRTRAGGAAQRRPEPALARAPRAREDLDPGVLE